MTRFEAVIHRAQRQLCDAAGRFMHEAAFDRLRQLLQRSVKGAVLSRLTGGQPRFGEMHKRILDRRTGDRRESGVQCRVEQSIGGGEARFDQRRSAFHDV